jgi:Methyltransferase domain
MAGVLTWEEGDRFVLGDTAFQAMPPGALSAGRDMSEGEFFIFKSRTLVDRYVALVEDLEPRNIFELGIWDGGSTMFLAELTRPRRLVSIDLEPMVEIRDRVQRHAARAGLGDVVRTLDEVNQADRSRLAEIVEREFDGDPLDLVVDDCSHLYEPTRASFNELFPRLRSGGAYVIEDWRWAHSELGSEHQDGFYPDEVPLTRLVFEIILALPSVPDLITDIGIELHAVVIRRGDAEIDPSIFDISACSNPRGQALLAPS